MVTLKKLKTKLLQMLQNDFDTNEYAYYTNNTVEDYQRPCFFTQETIKSVDAINNYARQVRVEFVIEYLQETVDEVDMLLVAETIRNIFGKLFKVETTPVYIETFSYDIVGNENEVLQIIMEVSYTESVGIVTTDAEIMGSLSYKQRNEVK